MKMSKNARKEIDNMVNSLAIKKEIKERPQQANSRANEQIHVNFMSLTINHVLGRRRNITKSKTET